MWFCCYAVLWSCCSFAMKLLSYAVTVFVGYTGTIVTVFGRYMVIAFA